MLLLGTAVVVVGGDDRTNPQVYAGLDPAEPEAGETKVPLGDASTPAVATNGKIAFIRTGPDDAAPKVFVMNDDGSNLTMIAETWFGSHLSWSPDGTKLAFEDVSGIYLINPDGTGKTRLPIEPDDHKSPSWSPDGLKLAVGSVEVGRGISVINVDGTGRTRLTDGRDPAWSPDGTRIAYTADDATGVHIYVMNADGSAQRRVTNLADRRGFPPAPAWSPDSRTIVFAHNETISVLDVDTREIRQIAAIGGNDAGNPIRSGDDDLSSRRGIPVTPRWSPDGEKITFALWESAEACSIWIMNADGTDPRELTDNRTCDSAPAWQPRHS